MLCLAMGDTAACLGDCESSLELGLVTVEANRTEHIVVTDNRVFHASLSRVMGPSGGPLSRLLPAALVLSGLVPLVSWGLLEDLAVPSVLPFCDLSGKQLLGFGYNYLG